MARQKTQLFRDAAPFRTLAHLANTGPQEESVLRDFIQAMCSASPNPRAAYHVLHTLAERGLIKTKVWVTPAGLAELNAQGWTPERLEDAGDNSDG